MTKIKCNIYRCSKRDEMYLYLPDEKTIADLPEELVALVKELTHVMDLELSPEKKLAREDVLLVMKNLEDKGYHLQMPPDPLKPYLYAGD
jgi:uncharacterized protein YcgL (UPF0745 family)